jgi:hypothetical protein
MKWLYDLLLVLLIILIIVFVILRLRRNLLVLWKEVSAKEIIFHRLLNETIIMFYEQKEILRNEDNRLQFVRLGRARKKRMRHLLLKERQDLYLALSDVYNEIEDREEPAIKELKKQFRNLQKIRRIYNSKVLIYNQTISVFPTRFLAIKMNLKIKEYFG